MRACRKVEKGLGIYISQYKSCGVRSSVRAKRLLAMCFVTEILILNVLRITGMIGKILHCL